MPTIRSLLDIITALGLTSGLKVCLDAGDSSSYAGGTGQTFSDRSGNGNDFKRGTSASADGADPTFNGTAGGLSSGEYFSFDGGDTLTIVGSNPLQSFHKDNAKLTILAGVYPGSTGNNSVIGDGIFTTNLGFRFQITNANKLAWSAGNGTTQVNLSIGTAFNIANTAWSVVGVSLDEAVGANGAFFFANGAVELFNSTYTSPSASNAAGILCLAGSEGATTAGRLVNGSRLAWIAVWDGVALTQAQVQAIYYEAGLRLGLAVGGDASLSGNGTLVATGAGAATGSASLSGGGALTAAGSVPGAEPAPPPLLVGPTLLAGAPLGSLPPAAMDLAATPPSDALSLFEQMADLPEVNIIHLARLSPLSKVA